MGTGTAPIVAIIAKIPMFGCGAPEPPRPGGSSPENCICVFVFVFVFVFAGACTARYHGCNTFHIEIRGAVTILQFKCYS